MRQSGIVAAGARFALENNIERLADDHENAKRLFAAIVDGRAPLHSGEWALGTIEVCLAMLRSARTEKDVKLKNQIALENPAAKNQPAR